MEYAHSTNAVYPLDATTVYGVNGRNDDVDDNDVNDRRYISQFQTPIPLCPDMNYPARGHPSLRYSQSRANKIYLEIPADGKCAARGARGGQRRCLLSHGISVQSYDLCLLVGCYCGVNARVGSGGRRSGALPAGGQWAAGGGRWVAPRTCGCWLERALQSSAVA